MSVSQEEKADRWDRLMALLGRPEIRDVYVTHLSSKRRAVLMLLASREELPESLVAELVTYRTRLDELYLEAADGFADIEGVLNMLPTYVTESIVGQLCQRDTDDESCCCTDCGEAEEET